MNVILLLADVRILYTIGIISIVEFPVSNATHHPTKPITKARSKQKITKIDFKLPERPVPEP